MHKFKLIAVCILGFFPVAALGGIDGDDLPSTSTWYFHADFKEMRSSDGGKSLWIWLDGEVFDDVRNDAGIDLAAEADRITAYATSELGLVFVLEGNISQETKDKALVAAAAGERFETLKYKGKTYYYVEGDGEIDSGNASIDGLGKQMYFSFAIKGKLIAASNKGQLQTLLDSGGKIVGDKSHDGALFVLTAEHSLIQAGMDTESIDTEDDDGGFKSNILRHTRHVALMIADVAGKIAIEAQLITEEPEMAESLASIVRGLIAMAAFSGEMEPEVTEFLQNTKVKVVGNQLKVSVTLSPEVILTALDEA